MKRFSIEFGILAIVVAATLANAVPIQGSTPGIKPLDDATAIGLYGSAGPVCAGGPATTSHDWCQSGCGNSFTALDTATCGQRANFPYCNNIKKPACVYPTYSGCNINQ